MNPHLQSSLIAIMLLVTSASAQTPARDPFAKAPNSDGLSTSLATGNLMFRVRLFALPSAMANEVLASPDLKSAPSTVLAMLEKLVVEKKARVVANPVVVGKPGVNLRSEGAVRLELNPVLEKDGRTVTFMMALGYQGGGDLRYDSSVQIGETEFAGTLELPASPRAPAGTEICLVFFGVQ